MALPPWLQDEGAWIAIGVSVLFVIAAFVMHRVVLKVLKTPEGRASGGPTSPEESRSNHE
jgi:peptidoglycan/LPS O-acetylase OafA/YrhL